MQLKSAAGACTANTSFHTEPPPNMQKASKEPDPVTRTLPAKLLTPNSFAPQAQLPAGTPQRSYHHPPRIASSQQDAAWICSKQKHAHAGRHIQ